MEIRLRNLIFFERINYSRFFELPIVVLAHLSSENQSIPCAAKRDRKAFRFQFKKCPGGLREHEGRGDIAAQGHLQVQDVDRDITRDV